ncbi:cytochrome P450 [Lentithecium fluviatile CBS 122367]|uniref:Cytochrome P450 n=1 Tax=Lentithecium fluviatile CBS 122367 TaxID=1168545 RepID=A0A6G1IN51_9PLEO|nr:cytochrome P450 [Lentithecium fluviatile CBS 122367]
MLYLIPFVGAATVLFVVFRRRYLSSISDIPGPFLASFSVAWQLWRIIKGDIDRQCSKLHEKYGHFVRISHEEVSVCHPDAIRQILLNPLHKSEWYSVVALPDQRFQTPMSTLDPKTHAQRSRNLAAGFAMTHVMKSEPYVDDAIRLLKSRFSEFSDRKSVIHLDHWFNYLAFDILGEIVFSQAFGFLEAGQDLGGSIANSKALTLYVTLAGFFQSIHRLTLGNPIISDRKLMPTQHIFDTTLRAIDNRQKNTQVRKDILSLWMKQREESPEKFSEKELYGCVNMTVGAGADTVSASLQSFFYHLTRYPQHLAKVKKEISDAGLTDDVISYTDAANLPFLQACIKEAWRMFPPVPFALARVVPASGVTIEGHYFHPGTKLSVNPHVIHYSRELFGDDAAEYNPERWLGPRAKEMDRQFIAFGAGFNSCQGRNIAQLEIYKATATIVRDFDFKQVDPKQDWKYDAYFTATPYGWPCYVQKLR